MEQQQEVKDLTVTSATRMSSSSPSSSSSASASAFYQYFATLSGALAIICSGLHFGWSSPTIPKLAKSNEIPFGSNDGALLVRFLLIGDIMGALLGGNVVDRIGRRLSILIAMVPYFVSWLLIANAQSIQMLLAARLLAGLSDGIVFTVVPIFLAEISEPKIRGFITAAITISLVSGMLIINVIGDTYSIRAVAQICSALPVIVFLMFFWVPESPYFYLIQEDKERARESLKALGRYCEFTLTTIAETIRDERQSKRNVFDLLRVRSNRKALAVAVCLRTIQQCSGGSIFTFYTKQIFEKASHNDPVLTKRSTVIYFLTQLVTCSLTSLTVDKIGRKPLLIFSCLGVALTLAYETVYFYWLEMVSESVAANYSWLSVTVLLIYTLMYSCGLAIVPIMMIGEIFPTNFKGLALSISDIYFAIIADFVAEAFDVVRNTYGFYVPFAFFVCVCLSGAVYIYYFVPETKKKSLEEIQMKLKMYKKRSRSKLARQSLPPLALNIDKPKEPSVIFIVPSNGSIKTGPLPNFVTHL